MIGDRWTDMNMQRPSGVGVEQNPHHHHHGYNPGWSGQETSYVQRGPTQSTLYVEGSLQPNRNYPTNKTPLAPMAPTNTGGVYYGQPVEDKQNVPSRQNYSRRIDYGSPGNGWKPMPPLDPLGGQQPLNLDYSPHSPGAKEPQSQDSLPGQKPINLDYDEEPIPQYLHNGLPPYPGSPPRFYPDQLPSGSKPIGRQQPVESSPDASGYPDQQNLWILTMGFTDQKFPQGIALIQGILCIMNPIFMVVSYLPNQIHQLTQHPLQLLTLHLPRLQLRNWLTDCTHFLFIHLWIIKPLCEIQYNHTIVPLMQELPILETPLGQSACD